MIEVKNHFVKHLFFWAILAITFILVAPALMDQSATSVTPKEREYFESIGVNVDLAELRAQNTFQSWFVATGIKESLDRVFKPKKSKDANKPSSSDPFSTSPSFSKMFSFSSGYVDGLWATVLKGLTRIHMLWPIMLAVLLCMGLPCLIDGIVTRAKKTYNFEYHNPVYFWTSGHAVVIVLGCSLMLPFLPLSITMLAVTAFTVVLCTSIWMLASNFQTGV